MKLHKNRELFREAVMATAQQLGIPAIYVEKDYWVTFALHTIYHHEIGKDTVFKGGTALAKCFGLLNRFSEDIDLIVLRKEGESNTRLTTKIRQISAVVNAALPEVEIAGITQKMGVNRKTAHTYSKEFQGEYAQIRDVIIVEATWLGYYEPYTIKTVNSFVYEMMVKTGQEVLAVENDLLPFEVMALEPVRTVCEKIMSLVRFSYSEEPLEELKKKIRHTYDLHQLLQENELSAFLDSPAFDEMLLKVANDDVVSFKNNNNWLIHHPNEAILFKEMEFVWSELLSTYTGEFKNLVFGDLPDGSDVLTTLKRIKKRLSTIQWIIKIE